jgi:hypothetical protein
MRRPSLLLCALLGAASFNASACFVVYDRSDRVVYRSLEPPVDMSRPIHETLPSRFPDGHMVFDTSNDCPAGNVVAARRRIADMTAQAPLLTEERTAVAMGMPHRRLPGGIALVQAKDANVAAGVTVIADTPMAASRPNTSVMGAGPSRPVITELRDPPVVIEQRGNQVTVRPAAR